LNVLFVLTNDITLTRDKISFTW